MGRRFANHEQQCNFFELLSYLIILQYISRRASTEMLASIPSSNDAIAYNEDRGSRQPYTFSPQPKEAIRYRPTEPLETRFHSRRALHVISN